MILHLCTTEGLDIISLPSYSNYSLTPYYITSIPQSPGVAESTCFPPRFPTVISCLEDLIKSGALSLRSLVCWFVCHEHRRQEVQ